MALQLVTKAVEVLETLKDYREGATLHQLHVRHGTPKATLHRLLQTLGRHGLAVHGPDAGVYRLGPRALSIVSDYLSKVSVQQEAYPYLAALSRQTQHSTYLCVFKRTEVICVESISSGGDIEYFVQVGRSMPLHASAGARAILAFLREETARDIVSGTELTRFTSNTPISLQEVLDELAETRRRGWALSEDEVDPGVLAMAAPVFDFLGRPVAGLGLLGVAQQMPEDAKTRFPRLLSEAAAAISGRLGYTLLSPDSELESEDGHGAP